MIDLNRTLQKLADLEWKQLVYFHAGDKDKFDEQFKLTLGKKLKMMKSYLNDKRI